MNEADWTQDRIQQQVERLGPWFHNLDLRGVQTAPAHFLGDYPNVKWKSFEQFIPDDLSGLSVLDIGCNAGFYSLEMKRRGAARVLGVDFDVDYLKQARFAADVMQVDVEFRELSVYHVANLRETFDVVLCLGLFYHLRHPLLALDLIHRHVARDLFVFQSMQRGSVDVAPIAGDYDFSEHTPFDEPGYPKLHFVERSYAHDNTNWWVPNRACSAAMLRSAGFLIESNPEQEVFICRRIDQPDARYGAVYPAGNDDR